MRLIGDTYYVVDVIAGFHSISFPNEWGGQNFIHGITGILSFHSISFPNEWGGFWGNGLPIGSEVSIQLVSPTSGEFL
jgi:hypothetical protein